MSEETYQALDRYFRTHKPDTRKEVLELAKSLASCVAAKAIKTHGDTCGILNIKDVALYLQMEVEVEIHRILIDLA